MQAKLLQRIKINVPKGKKAGVILLSALSLLMLLTAVNVVFSFYSIVKTVEASIADQGIAMAKSIAEAVDRPTYQKFLKDPQKNEAYWKVRDQLNDARQKIGAMHVYTLKVDNPRQAVGLIIGAPREDDRYPIGEPCTVPPGEVKLAMQGKTYTTSILTDAIYGDYLSVGAPIVDGENGIIGYLGIDFSIDMVDAIKQNVIKSSLSTFIFNVLFVIVLLVAYSLLHTLYQRAVKDTITDTEQTYQDEFKNILESIKSLKHDFVNHMQVINGLLELNQYEKASDYMKGLIHETKLVDLALKVNNPALLVLLQSKWLMLQNSQIEMACDISADAFDRINSTDLIKIMSNLIDNAMDATLMMPPEFRRIKVTCRQLMDNYLFEVENSGRRIPETEQQRIFERGYSTKQQSETRSRGYGLSIITDTVQKYEGEVHLDSNGQRTLFRIILPILNELG